MVHGINIHTWPNTRWWPYTVPVFSGASWRPHLPLTPLPWVLHVPDIAFHIRQPLPSRHTPISSLYFLLFHILSHEVRKMWLCFICESQGNLDHNWKATRSIKNILRSRQKDVMSKKYRNKSMWTLQVHEKGWQFLFLLLVGLICPPRKLILSSLSFNGSSKKKSSMRA